MQQMGGATLKTPRIFTVLAAGAAFIDCGKLTSNTAPTLRVILFRILLGWDRIATHLAALIFLLMPLATSAQERPTPSASWMLKGLEQAVDDSAARTSAALLMANDQFVYDFPNDQASDVVDKLVTLLEHPDSNVRIAAAQSLGQVTKADRSGSVTNRLLLLLRNSDSDYSRGVALHAIGQIAGTDHAGDVIDQLLPLLRDPNSYLRQETAEAIGRAAVGSLIPVVTNKLLQLLDDPDSIARAGAAATLGQIAGGDRPNSVVDALLQHLEDSSNETRVAAADALGFIPSGNAGGNVIEKLLPLLDDRQEDVRNAAAHALGRIPPGDRIGRVIDKLLPLLGDPIQTLRSSPQVALEQISSGDRAASVIDKLLPLLNNRVAQVRRSAADALGQIPLGDRTVSVIDKLLPLLSDPDDGVRRTTAAAFELIPPGDRANSVIDKLLPLLMDRDSGVRRAVARAFWYIPVADRSSNLIDGLLPQLTNPDGGVRAASAIALGRIPAGDRTRVIVDRLQKLLIDPDANVQFAAVQAFGEICERDPVGGVVLLYLLEDPKGAMGARVAETLGNVAKRDPSGKVIENLLTKLAHSESQVREAAASALVARTARGDRVDRAIDVLFPYFNKNLLNEYQVLPLIASYGPGDLSTALIAVKQIHESELAATGWLRAVAQIVTGHDEQARLLLAWLGRPTHPPLASVDSDPPRAHAVLSFLAQHWDTFAKTKGLHEEVESRVIEIINAACHSISDTRTARQWGYAFLSWIQNFPMEGPVQRCWTIEQRKSLEFFREAFKDVQSSHERAILDDLARENVAPIGRWLTWSVFGWALFWAAFLFAYPWSKSVQAVFFWNPKVRGLMSLWFMPIILFMVPSLRRRLLAPVRDALIAGARISDLQQLAFFGQARAELNGGPPTKIEDILPNLSGTVVIRGDAGLGKTSALRWFAANTSLQVVFLSAQDCAAGVDSEIARLMHYVQETGFVRSMVHAGTLTVIVDGLNEVSADTREKISSFARDMSKGNVFISTQPIEWRPPPHAHVLDLLPLDRSDAKDFLISRPVGSDKSSPRHGPAYVDSVETFLRRALDEAPSLEDRRAAALILSNPFDLSFAADLIAQGQMPVATALIGEAFRLADEGEPGKPGYRQIAGQPFPLEQFGRKAIVMRVADRNWILPSEFAAEISCLLDRKLLVRRVVRGSAGLEERIQFRHDKVWDFFIAAAFAADASLMQKHFTDPRFRGSYLRIAETWEADAAVRVREYLVISAAEGGDHSTSDEFIKRLEARRRRPRRPGTSSI
jgi:HEAT repeat protein